MTDHHVPGPYVEFGPAIYASQPQPVDAKIYRGFHTPEPGRGYLIAESIPHAPTRRLLAQAPAMRQALVDAQCVLSFSLRRFLTLYGRRDNELARSIGRVRVQIGKVLDDVGGDLDASSSKDANAAFISDRRIVDPVIDRLAELETKVARLMQERDAADKSDTSARDLLNDLEAKLEAAEARAATAARRCNAMEESLRAIVESSHNGELGSAMAQRLPNLERR